MMKTQVQGLVLGNISPWVLIEAAHTICPGTAMGTPEALVGACESADLTAYNRSLQRSCQPRVRSMAREKMTFLQPLVR